MFDAILGYSINAIARLVEIWAPGLGPGLAWPGPGPGPSEAGGRLIGGAGAVAPAGRPEADL